MKILVPSMEEWRKNHDIFSTRRAAGQGHPIESFLIILILEIFFLLLKADSHVKDTDIYYLYCYSASPKNLTFFKK